MLSPRLMAIYNMIPHCGCLFDIGTDHGFIPVEAVKCGIAERAVACDISVPSLAKAEKNARLSGLRDKIETRAGSGLDPMHSFEADVIVIAGMGGILISDILKKGFADIGGAKLILQPMTAVTELREGLISNGFKITDEELVAEDRRIYNIISAEIGNTESYESEIGQLLMQKKHPLLGRWLSEKISAEERLLAKIPRENADFGRHSVLISKYKEAAKQYEGL